MRWGCGDSGNNTEFDVLLPFGGKSHESRNGHQRDDSGSSAVVHSVAHAEDGILPHPKRRKIQNFDGMPPATHAISVETPIQAEAILSPIGDPTTTSQAIAEKQCIHDKQLPPDYH